MLLALRNASQPFESDGDLRNTAADSYVDLLDWTQKIRNAPQITDPVIQRAADHLITLFVETKPNRFVIANEVASAVLYLNNQLVALDGANGISLYLPPDKQSGYGREYGTYLQNGFSGLTVASRWDNFLATSLGTPKPEDNLAPALLPLAPGRVSAAVGKIFLPLIQR